MTEHKTPYHSMIDKDDEQESIRDALKDVVSSRRNAFLTGGMKLKANKGVSLHHMQPHLLPDMVHEGARNPALLLFMTGSTPLEEIGLRHLDLMLSPHSEPLLVRE